VEAVAVAEASTPNIHPASQVHNQMAKTISAQEHHACTLTETHQNQSTIEKARTWRQATGRLNLQIQK